MQARARSALLLSVVPLGSYLARRISSLLMNLCGRLVVNGFKKDQHEPSLTARYVRTHGIHEGLRGEVFIEKIIPKYGATKRIHNTLAATYACSL